MSADLSNYDIYIYKGNTYKLDFSYTDNNNIGIDLSNYEAKMQVRRSAYQSLLLAELNENYPKGSFGRGLSGDFLSGAGITGFTGGLVLNYNGITGDVHLEIDSETTYGIPVGRHSYDLQLTNLSTGSKISILKGRIEMLSSSRLIERSAAGISGGTLGVSS